MSTSEFGGFLFVFLPEPVYKLHYDWMWLSYQVLFRGLWRKETGDPFSQL